MNDTKDLHLFESGSGGELSLLNNDLELSESLFQVIYISLFGGNLEASTKGNEVDGQERFDYWGNQLLFSEQPQKQFNSETERVLNTTVLNSSGRILIQQAVETDLNFLNQIAQTQIEVSILDENQLQILIRMQALSNQQTTTLTFVYNNASNEIINQRTI